MNTAERDELKRLAGPDTPERFCWPFICAARAAIPELLADVERLEAENAELKERLKPKTKLGKNGFPTVESMPLAELQRAVESFNGKIKSSTYRALARILRERLAKGETP